MFIGGIQTLTLLDYPGKVSCVIFTAGCNFRCGYCHNPQFVLSEQIKGLSKNTIPEEKIFKFLESRKRFLQGVVLSGGEPTLQPDLIDFAQKIKDMGFAFKLDTNGTNPIVVQELIKQKLVDYIAMDIKAPPSHYREICGVEIDTDLIFESRDIILNSNLDHEFRTTVIREFHDAESIGQIVRFCEGAQQYTIQNFRPEKVLDNRFQNYSGFSPKELENFKQVAKSVIENVQVLG